MRLPCPAVWCGAMLCFLFRKIKGIKTKYQAPHRITKKAPITRSSVQSSSAAQRSSAPLSSVAQCRVVPCEQRSASSVAPLSSAQHRSAAPCGAVRCPRVPCGAVLRFLFRKYQVSYEARRTACTREEQKKDTRLSSGEPSSEQCSSSVQRSVSLSYTSK